MEEAHKTERRLAAILSADVHGYSRRMADDEAATVSDLKRCREIIGAQVREHHGHIVDAPGDNVLAEFPSAVEAVQCGVEVQRELADRNGEVEPSRKMEFRIGIHVGDVISDGIQIYGDGVNIAARLEGLAQPGGICLSAAAHEQIRGKLDIDCEDIGERQVKNIPRPVRVLRVRMGTTTALATRSPSRRPVIIGSIATICVIGAAVAAYFIVARNSHPASVTALAGEPSKATVAVLPFANLSASKDDEYFSDGMTDEIIGDLSKIAGMQVAARTSSFAFKGKNEDAKKIAELLKVRNLLEGSVRRSADKLRIEVQLVDASSGFTLWSQRFDENANDVFQIQSEVSESVAEKLKVRLLANERERVEKKPTQNLEAYDLYLQGRYYLSQFSEDGWKKAIDDFNQAIVKDPKFALAYEGLGEAYGWEAAFSLPPRDAIPKAKILFQRALALDDNLAAAHGAMAYFVLFGYEWNWPAAEREFKRALELDSSNAQIHIQYGDFLVAMERFDEAIREKQYAHQLDPLQVQTLVEIGMVYRDARNYERSYEYSQQAIKMAPNYWAGYWMEGISRVSQKDYAGAVIDFEKAESLVHYPTTKAALAMIYALTGRRADALRLLDELKELSTHRYVDPVAFVSVYAGLGDKDEAFKCLDKAYDDRSFFLVMMNMPQWDGNRSDPRFQAMRKKVGLPPQCPHSESGITNAPPNPDRRLN